MQRVLILSATTVVALGLGLPRYQGMRQRLAQLERESQQVPTRERSLQERIDLLSERVNSLACARQDASLRQAAERVILQGDLWQLEEKLNLSRVHLESVEGEDLERGERTNTRLTALESALRSDQDGLRSAVEAAAELATETREELEGLVEPSERERWGAMLGPSVKLAGAATVGSGVLLPSRMLEDGSHETLILTAWHVVRDIRADALEVEPLIPITIYGEVGDLRHEEARLLAYQPLLDVAILELLCKDRLPHGARLAPPTSLRDARIFNPVVAVGCPLGTDPIPTKGEVASTAHFVDGATYWMINAPAYIGNSGGAVFDARTHRVLGVFSKIYTHGNLRPTVVPHLGLVTPMDRVYEWLETVQEVAVVITPAEVQLYLVKAQE